MWLRKSWRDLSDGAGGPGFLCNRLAFPGVLGDVGCVVPNGERPPLWLYPNLLSLDAPLVSLAWLHVFSQTWRLYLPWEVYLSLGLGVWVIYAADRLLDVAMAGASGLRMEARHRFHHKHRKIFVTGLIVAVLLAIALVTTRMPVAIFKYLLIGGVLVAGFFGLSMISTQESHDVAHTKNTVAGITFAYGTVVMAHLYRNEVPLFGSMLSSEFLCFAVLCVLNVSAIDVWEFGARSKDEDVRNGNEMLLTAAIFMLGFTALWFAVKSGDDAIEPAMFSTRPFFYAIFTGAALLYFLHRERGRCSSDAQRVLADVVLLVPVLVFVAASRA
jgi:hypothetical protein